MSLPLSQTLTNQAPFSVPVVPAQPDTAYYGIGELALFKTFSRDTYRETFGEDAPPFDPDRPVKTWFDSTVDTSASGNVALYKTISRDSQNKWAVRQLVISASEAASVNLPGAITYPERVIPASSATRGGATISSIYLSLEPEARQLMEELGGSNLDDEGDTSLFPVIYPANDPRRMWYFLFNKTAINVGALLYNRNRKGIGAPGRWDFSSGIPEWVAAPDAPTGIGDRRPPREMPVRELLPNEQLQIGLMGVGIARTDLAEQIADTSGQFTQRDREMLGAIHQMLSEAIGASARKTP